MHNRCMWNWLFARNIYWVPKCLDVRDISWLVSTLNIFLSMWFVTSHKPQYLRMQFSLNNWLNMCIKDFNCHQNLNMMMNTGEKPFKCSVCEYSCSHSGHLKTHMMMHTGEKPFNCSVCEYSYSNSGHLKTHMMMHTGEKPFKCSVCEYSFFRSETCISVITYKF